MKKWMNEKFTYYNLDKCKHKLIQSTFENLYWKHASEAMVKRLTGRKTTSLTYLCELEEEADTLDTVHWCPVCFSLEVPGCQAFCSGRIAGEFSTQWAPACRCLLCTDRCVSPMPNKQRLSGSYTFEPTFFLSFIETEATFEEALTHQQEQPVANQRRNLHPFWKCVTPALDLWRWHLP